MNILTPTSDGSNTLFNEAVGEYYHSTHGALQESKHVFIEAGLKYLIQHKEESVFKILEVGFGTGLNFILSFDHCHQHQIKINYTGIEAFPLDLGVIQSTDYHHFVKEEIWDNFTNQYAAALENEVELSSYCRLEIAHTTLDQFDDAKQFDLLYYDAFSVRHQPEMWTDEMIAKACSYLKPGGIFVSYAITGNLKRALKSCGMAIAKLPGAPGKREMIRAIKLD